MIAILIMLTIAMTVASDVETSNGDDNEEIKRKEDASIEETERTTKIMKRLTKTRKLKKINDVKEKLTSNEETKTASNEKTKSENEETKTSSEIKAAIQERLEAIQDINSKYILNEKLGLALANFLEGKMSIFPLFKMTLKIDKKPMKIPQTLLNTAAESQSNARATLSPAKVQHQRKIKLIKADEKSDE